MNPSQKNTEPLKPPAGLRWAVRAAGTRLRFVAVFVAVFAVIGGWETIRTYWGRLWLTQATERATSADTEYFCPMDPGVLSDWPAKCPVCNMTLVRKKRGEATPLPNGVLARMQITPYRLMLGGIETRPAEYQALSKQIELTGTVVDTAKETLKIQATAFPAERAWLHEGLSLEVFAHNLPTAKPLASGLIKKAAQADAQGQSEILVECKSPTIAIPPGSKVLVKCTESIDTVEPFRSQPSQPPPLAKNEPRNLFTCMDHPDIAATKPGKCPRDQQPLMPRTLLANQRVRWWCPMHPDVTADHDGAKCEACSGMLLVPRAVSYRPPGKVLAVPASAVIEVGRQQVVYLDQGDGMFDARKVATGPACGSMLPVISGLEPGERVVFQSAFLLDAEARLDPNLAAGYFGAGPRGSGANTSLVASATIPEWLEGLPEADHAAALSQATCPVTNKPLGSMGVPLKIDVNGRPIFICCEGCEGALQGNPQKYLARLKKTDTVLKKPDAAEKKP